MQTHRPSVRRISALCFALFTSACLSFQVHAHPHSWVDMTTIIEGDKNGITGFKNIWTFDAMTTAYLFDGEDMSPKHRQTTLDKLANSILHNMLSTHYFTYFYHNKTPIRYLTGKDPILTTAKGKATYRFTLPLTKPYPLTTDPLKFLIFDPTYYVDMSWKGRDNIVLSPELKKYCDFKIIEPHPTPKQVARAAAIPIDADPDDTLGQLFTQSLTLTCHPSH
ncbi:DUF1007 family protein [Vibrio nitrifigilis]|uniref:DUF1007 family protein n=1 Tax=Vibrio nitrifigilis TaxID=2789781 RepID=UPI002E381A6A|nr:DUF1007 family protein [Vibrio nitrifigilis]